MTFNVKIPEAVRGNGPLHGCPVPHRVTDRFSRFDLNVEVEDSDADALTDWCEDNAVECELV